MILGYRLDDYQECRIKTPVHVTLPKKTSSLLIAGRSGSGKSTAALWYIWNLLKRSESSVYVSDYKAGEEYEAFEGSPAYASGADAVEMIRDYYRLFCAVREHRARLRQHHTLFIEEWFGLLGYCENQSKKLKTELQQTVGEMLAVSRGLNMGIFCCVQRADAALFSQGAREQFQAVLSFGRTSTEQFRMLGFSGELEENPTAGYRAGQALALIDGQESVCPIIVPWITNSAAMKNGIRRLLDEQTALPELARAIAEGESPGQGRRTV